MLNSRIIVVGSSNTDMVVRTDRFPKPGETILGYEFFMAQGGKGANQAVAAARLGGDIVFVCCLGADVFGKNAIHALQSEGIDVSYVKEMKESSSGVAVITVDKYGQNNIVVASGANAKLLPEEVQDVLPLFFAGDYLLMQLEIPIETVQFLAKEAYQRDVKVILNPAPAQHLPTEIYEFIYLLTPNEEEASLMSGVTITDLNSAKEAARTLVRKGLKNVLITLGKKGALALFEGEFFYVNSREVEVIDTTAAGDVFNGAITVAFSEGKNILEAMKFAINAASIAVTRLGAQTSAPSRIEVDRFV